MSQHTPTTDQVREWALYGFGEYKDLGGDWFDRWLQQVKAQVWDEGQCAGYENAMTDERGLQGHGHYTTNPYRTQDGK